MRITIRVRPGSAHPGVGGEHDGALVVRVSARAVDGKATEAALAAVAGSFGVRRNAVRLVSGASSRTKIVDIDADDPRILASLLAAPPRLPPRRDAAVARPSITSDPMTLPASAPAGHGSRDPITPNTRDWCRDDLTARWSADHPFRRLASIWQSTEYE
jgi:uncharacterized protein YggU (UPF0235/DUF167 family)